MRALRIARSHWHAWRASVAFDDLLSLSSGKARYRGSLRDELERRRSTLNHHLDAIDALASRLRG